MESARRRRSAAVWSFCAASFRSLVDGGARPLRGPRRLARSTTRLRHAAAIGCNAAARRSRRDRRRRRAEPVDGRPMAVAPRRRRPLIARLRGHGRVDDRARHHLRRTRSLRRARRGADSTRGQRDARRRAGRDASRRPRRPRLRADLRPRRDPPSACVLHPLGLAVVQPPGRNRRRRRSSTRPAPCAACRCWRRRPALRAF